MFPVDSSSPTWFERLIARHGIETALDIWTARNTQWFEQHPNLPPTPETIRKLIDQEWRDAGCPDYDEWNNL